MDSRKIARIAICALFLCLILVTVIETAEAGRGEQAPAQPDDNTPTRVQMMLGVGSLIVAIIVIKWL